MIRKIPLQEVLAKCVSQSARARDCFKIPCNCGSSLTRATVSSHIYNWYSTWQCLFIFGRCPLESTFILISNWACTLCGKVFQCSSYSQLMLLRGDVRNYPWQRANIKLIARYILKSWVKTHRRNSVLGICPKLFCPRLLLVLLATVELTLLSRTSIHKEYEVRLH